MLIAKQAPRARGQTALPFLVTITTVMTTSNEKSLDFQRRPRSANVAAPRRAGLVLRATVCDYYHTDVIIIIL